MRLLSVATLAVAALMSTSAAAETQAPSEPTKATEKVAPAEKKVCKRLATTGSRMEERVCLTKEEWKAVEKQMEN
jgi:hypothetical protein